MPRVPTNIAASIHARLLNHARGASRPFSDILQLYAMERFLHRLSRTTHANCFVLKGALLLRAWDPLLFRTTRDIDLLGQIANQIDSLERAIRDACLAVVHDDGLTFDAATVRGESIIEDADYPGVRLTFDGSLGKARIAMQIDVGFGDIVTPSAVQSEFPTLLDMPGPRLLAYPPETVTAEKVQVMLFRAEANTRLKDFHDLWWISRHFPLECTTLVDAIRATCTQRDTEIVAQPIALTSEFAAIPDRRARWRAFRARIEPTRCPRSFDELIAQLQTFLLPVLATATGQPLNFPSWIPTKGWSIGQERR